MTEANKIQSRNYYSISITAFLINTSEARNIDTAVLRNMQIAIRFNLVLLPFNIK